MTPPPEIAYIALGSNLGDREAHLAFARLAIAALPGTSVVAVSAVEETAPIGGVPQGPYLNQMIAVETRVDARDLLAHLQRIERAAERVRAERWGPRTLDLDIIRYGDRRIDDADLVVPHPEIGRRDFWRREIAELDEAVTGRTRSSGAVR